MKRFGSCRVCFTASLLVAGCLLPLAIQTASAQTNCVPSPFGLVSWWRGEGDTVDFAGGNNGTLVGNAAFASGQDGQAFAFDGDGDAVSVGNPPNLHLQDLTIEAWVKRSSTTLTTYDQPNGAGMIFGYGYGGYGLYLDPSGRPVLTRVAIDDTRPSVAITDTNFHHVAVTKSGSTVVFYVDGASYSAPAYNPGFSFSTPAAVGARGDYFYNGFLGVIDEVSIYNHALTAAEVQTIYTAGSLGKCATPIPPSILGQPSPQTIDAGGSVSFSVAVSGSPPLIYQWLLEGAVLSGQTGAGMVLTNVQGTDAGNYSVMVTNPAGAALSSNALLTVLVPQTNCTAPPSGVVSWWQGESNSVDTVGANNGMLPNGATFAAGKVGQAINLNGTSQYISIPDNPSLRPANITVEGWFNFGWKSGLQMLIAKPYGSASADSFNVWYNGSSSSLWAAISTTNRSGPYLTYPWTPVAGVWHHIAYTFDNTISNQVLYVDGVVVGSGVSAGPMAYDTHALQIGADTENGSRNFYLRGLVDEVSLYNRALTASEIQSIYTAGSLGKCVPIFPPTIATQPASQTILVGATASFNVAAGGTAPFDYQWSFNGTNLAGASAATLTLTNVQLAQAGNYAVTVTNLAGSAISSNALLTVNLPPAAVKVVSVSNAPAGGACIVPIQLVANGNENALGFTLNFSPTLLSYSSVSLGSGASGASLFVNSSQIGSGKLGLILALPADSTFAAGTQEAVQITLVASVVTNAAVASLTFGDSPIGRQLTDAPGNNLPATFTGGTVAIAAAEFEGDLFPRPNGNRAVTINDWVLAGRYAARLDYPTNAAEFQRADCAPRSTLGDGAITVIDWVQAGRYAAGLDPLTPVGGPSSEVTNGITPLKVLKSGRKDLSRQLSVLDATLLAGQTGTVSVTLQAQGNENALGFSLSFDPAVLSYSGYTPGSAASGATLNFNAAQAGSGRLGAVLALGTGSSFSNGTKEIVKLSFRAVTSTAGDYSVSFSNLPIPCQVSDTAAQSLATIYANGKVTINPLPSLRIAQSGQDITLTWPLWASNFVLQQADASLSPTAWSNLPGGATIINNERVLTAPMTGNSTFYRLRLP